MTKPEVAVLPLSATGVTLIRSRSASGVSTLAIPRSRPIADEEDARAITFRLLGIDAQPETLDAEAADGEIAFYRVRIPGRSRPRTPEGTSIVQMDFAAFEQAIATGEVSDLPTIAAWLRHRLAEGEITRRRRLPRPVAWTSESDAALRRMWSEGSTGGDIARTIGTTRNAVMGRIHRLGLSGQGGSVPVHVAREAAFRREIENEFQAAFGRPPVDGRRGDAATLVALAAMRVERSPNVVARLTGIGLHEVMEILSCYHDRGLWRSDDPAPERWKGDGRLLSLMMDAQLAYGVFRDQAIR